MKRIIILFIAIIATNIAFTQTPMQFKYQAVLRDASGGILANKPKTIIINILQGSTTGTSVFTETQSVTTTAQGLINLNIGSVNTSGITSINWSANTYFIEITVDGVVMGTSQLLSVPYALYAKNAGNGFSGSYNDLTNKPSLFSGSYNDLTNKPLLFSGNYSDLTNKPTLFDGTWTSLTGKPTFAAVATSGSYNDLINLPNLFNGTWTSLTGKPSFATVATSGSYTDLTNIPSLSLTGNALSLSNGGGSVNINQSQWTSNGTGNISYNYDVAVGGGINASTVSISGASGGLTIYGNSNPLIIFTPNASATKSAAIHQSTDHLLFGANGINNIFDIDLGAPSTSVSITSNGNLKLLSSDVYLTNSSNGVILKSPNGNCWRITIDNTGNIVRTAITCPQ